jgi:flagellin
MIDSEYQAMCSEITRIANATDFNGIHMLNGHLSGDYRTHNGNGIDSIGALKIHFGSGNDSAEDYYYVSMGTATASALGIGQLASAKFAVGDTRSGTASDNAGKSISTQELAQQTLNAINQAIISKDKIRASLGALQNRLQNTITNLSIQAENMQASESRISDVDVAQEMTEFTRQQILTQASVAMRSQANGLPRLALQLMGG